MPCRVEESRDGCPIVATLVPEDGIAGGPGEADRSARAGATSDSFALAESFELAWLDPRHLGDLGGPPVRAHTPARGGSKERALTARVARWSSCTRRARAR